MHFCGDDFQRINVFADYKTCCESNVPMQGCCDDVSNLELPNSDQKISSLINFQAIGLDYIHTTFLFELPENFVDKIGKTAYVDSSPPIFQNTPIYIFYQVFLL